MRDFLSLIFTAFLLIATSLSCLAFSASNTYNIDELGVQVTIPTGYYDSIKFDKTSPVAYRGKDNSSFIYTDTDSGVTFNVPANWQQKDFSKDREYIDAKFVFTQEDVCVMIFGSIDVWSEMSTSDKYGYTRSDLNNSAFTKSDIAVMYNTTADKISTVTYNGVEYFKGEVSSTTNIYGVDVTLTMTQLVYTDNGWMYMFQFGGTSDHNLYSDFENMLRSVQYPTVSDVSGVGSTNNTSSNNSNDNANDSSGIIAVFVLLVVAVIVVVVVISHKKNNKSAKCTPIYNTSTNEPPNKSESTIYCTKCGQVLPLDSVFCHKCGTKIEKEI